VEDIYADIHDLAGVRVAIYFPGEREQVGLAIKDLFVLLHTTEFPDPSKKPELKYAKRFAGYSATHYRVRLRETMLDDSQKRYAEARVEIQVASVLMHAWAEVEHDLVYKPFQGDLSEDEYAIIDELNGIVMAGEIALERLQRAGEVRVAARGRAFGNHYELAAHLLSTLREFAEPDVLQAGLGRVDLLYTFLAKLGLATSDDVGRYLTALHPDLERRPIAEQIIEQLLSEDSERYNLYQEIRVAHPPSDVTAEAAEPVASDVLGARGRFLTAWIELERVIQDMAPPALRQRGPVIPTAQLLRSIAHLDPETLVSFERLRRMRNYLVHGIEVPDPSDLCEAAQQIDALRRRLLGKEEPPA
jgi:hypothetical protein